MPQSTPDLRLFLAAFCSTNVRLLGQFRSELSSLRHELQRDFDKKNLQVFTQPIISSFNGLQAATHGSQILAGEIGLHDDDRLMQLFKNVQMLNMGGTKLMLFTATVGTSATAHDFDKAVNLIDEVVLAINQIVDYCGILKQSAAKEQTDES